MELYLRSLICLHGVVQQGPGTKDNFTVTLTALRKSTGPCFDSRNTRRTHLFLTISYNLEYKLKTILEPPCCSVQLEICANRKQVRYLVKMIKHFMGLSHLETAYTQTDKVKGSHRELNLAVCNRFHYVNLVSCNNPPSIVSDISPLTSTTVVFSCRK